MLQEKSAQIKLLKAFWSGGFHRFNQIVTSYLMLTPVSIRCGGEQRFRDNCVKVDSKQKAHFSGGCSCSIQCGDILSLSAV